MESFELVFGGCRESFETDEFYETIQAPKFHDFTAPEEPMIEPEAWFNGNPGATKKVVAAAIEVLSGSQNPKTHKGVHSNKTKDVHNSMPVSLHQAPSKIPAPEKGVSAGGGKIPKGSASASMSPLMTKSLRNGNNVDNNASTHPIVVEKLTEALKSMSVVTTWQPSENDDPNPAIGMARNSPAVTPSKPGKQSKKPPAVLSEDLAASRTTNLKNVEATLPSSGPQTTTPAPKETVVLSEVLADGSSKFLETGDLVRKACDTVLSSKKDTSGKGAGVAATKALKSKIGEASSSPATFQDSASQEPSTPPRTAATCKTPVKEPASKDLEGCSEHVKGTACNEVTASPSTGHHCQSSRCAANDPNYNSPASIPRKKYLMARQGVPGSRVLFRSDRTKENPEAGKVQGDLQQKGDPSGNSNISEVTIPKDNNPEEVVEVGTDLFFDEKDTGVQELLNNQQAVVQEEVSEESIRSQSAQLVQNSQERCNPTDIEHVVGQEERVLKDNNPEEVVVVAADLLFDEKNMSAQESLDKQHAVARKDISEESRRSQSAQLFQRSQESCNPMDIQHVVGQEEREGSVFEHLVQELQESCNPEVKTDLQLGDSQVDSVESSSSEEGTCNPEVKTEALVPEGDKRPSTGTLFGERIQYAPSAPEGPQYFEDLATMPVPEGVENGGLMSEEGKTEQATMSFLCQSGRKRKSQELGNEVGSKKVNYSPQVSRQHSKTHGKEALCGCTTKLQKKITIPHPFRLRTQERGAFKEIKFNKKMEEYLAARERFHSAFQGLAVLHTQVEGKSLRQGIHDPGTQPDHLVFGANQADPAEQQVQEKQDPKRRQKQTMPAFDHPFKPRRSTKKLTVPQEFKFHAINGTRTCTLHSR